MTTNQHTPGPWRFADYASGPTIYGADNSAIARIEQWKGKYETVQDANARLIAAAPELLAALQNVMAMYDSLTKAAKHGADCPCYHCQARAAISKATGA